MTDYLGREADYLHQTYDWTTPEFVSVFDELSLWSAPFGLALLKYVRLRPGLQVLDLGCGAGFPLLELAQRLGSSCTAYGLDPWAAALVRAGQKISRWHVPNARLAGGDGAAMPFSDEQFDLIVSNLGLNNFEQPDRVMAECFRVTAPAGQIALTTNPKGHMQEFYEILAVVLNEYDRLEALERLQEHVAHRFTAESAAGLLATAGFRISRVFEDSFTMRFLDGSALLRHAFIGVGFLDAWRAVVGPEDEQVIFLSLEERLNRLAGERGELGVTIPLAYVEGEKR